jgi:CBS domain-containing protein
VYDYEAGKQDWLAAGLPSEGRLASEPRIRDVARTDVPTCRLDEPVQVVRDRANAHGFDAAVVTNEERVVLGLLRAKELDEGGDTVAERAMRPAPSTFRPNVGVLLMAATMVEHDLPNAPVTTSDGRLVGLLVREDLLRAAHELHLTSGHGEGEGHDH